MTTKAALQFVLRLPEYLIGVLVLALTILVNAEVLLRYFLDLPVAEVDEVVRVLFVWVTFLGAAVGVEKGDHMSLDFLRGKLSPRLHFLVGRLAALLVIGLGAYLLYDGIRFEGQAFRSILTITGWSTGWQFLVIPLSGGLMVLYGLRAMLDTAGPRSAEGRAQ